MTILAFLSSKSPSEQVWWDLNKSRSFLRERLDWSFGIQKKLRFKGLSNPAACGFARRPWRAPRSMAPSVTGFLVRDFRRGLSA